MGVSCGDAFQLVIIATDLSFTKLTDARMHSLRCEINIQNQIILHFKVRQIPQLQWRLKHWPTKSKTMILAALATRVDILNLLQFGDEPR